MLLTGVLDHAGCQRGNLARENLPALHARGGIVLGALKGIVLNDGWVFIADEARKCPLV